MTITTQIISDGPRNALVKVVGVLTTADQPLVQVVTPANFAFNPATFKINYLDYSISDQLEVQLFWGTTPNSGDVLIMPLAGRGRMSFDDFGGLTNNAPALGNGGIDLQTTGWTSGTQIFTIILELIKQATPVYSL